MRSTWHPVCVPGESFRTPRCRSRRRAADQRQHERRGADAEPDEASSLGAAAAYPANLTAGNLAYFLVVPTLIYQPSYPRSTRFRGRWLLLCAPLCRARSGRCQSTIDFKDLGFTLKDLNLVVPTRIFQLSYSRSMRFRGRGCSGRSQEVFAY